MSLLRLMILNLSLLLSIQAFGTLGKEGHGGYGVLIGGKPYLLDFVEQGLEYSPYVDTDQELDIFLKSDLDRALVTLKLSDEALNLLTYKIQEIREVSPILAFTYLSAIRLYNWTLVNEELIHSPDFSSVIKINGKKMQAVPIANRLEQYIRIWEKYWNDLDDYHKVGLIIHEMTYAFVRSANEETSIDENILFEKSRKAKDITGYLFSEAFKFRGLIGFMITNNGTIPFNFTNEKVNPYNFTWVSELVGYSLKRGVTHAVLRATEFKGKSPIHMEHFYIDNTVDPFDMSDKLSTQVEDYCSRLQELSGIKQVNFTLEFDPTKIVYVRFKTGRMGSNLIINEGVTNSFNLMVDGNWLEDVNICKQILSSKLVFHHSNYGELIKSSFFK